MLLDITVSDPETHVGTKTSLSFVDFKVATVTDDSRYAARDFFVRRRYRDFVWLRSQLTQACPGAIVPPLPPPDKPYKGELNRFDADFIARRQAGLELFLRRVAAHGRLSASADLLTFLEAKVWELQTAKNASSSSWVSSVLDSTDASMKRVASALRTKTPDDDEVARLCSPSPTASPTAPPTAPASPPQVEKLRAFAAEYHSVVKATEAAHHTTVSTLAEAASDLSHLGHAFDLLSQSERELSLPFTHMAKTLDAMRELFLKQVPTETSPSISRPLPPSPVLCLISLASCRAGADGARVRSDSAARVQLGERVVPEGRAQEPRPCAHPVQQGDGAARLADKRDAAVAE